MIKKIKDKNHEGSGILEEWKGERFLIKFEKVAIEEPNRIFRENCFAVVEMIGWEW